MISRNWPLSPGLSLLREMDRAQRNAWRNSVTVSRPSFPALNVYRQPDSNGLDIVALVPGVAPEDLDVSVDGRTLTLKGTRPDWTAEREGEVLRHELGSGDFRRTLTLPFHIDAERVTATFEHGVLRIGLQPVKAQQPRKIAVKTEA